MKNISWITNAYKSTTVYWGKSQSDIIKMLEQIGITQTRFTNLDDRFVLEFMAKFDEKTIPRAVRIIVPLMTPISDSLKRNRELNIVYRILLNHLKAKFVAIGNGITEFESEFMAHLVITDKAGKSTTMGEALLPQYQKNIQSGENIPFTLLGDGQK